MFFFIKKLRHHLFFLQFIFFFVCGSDGQNILGLNPFPIIFSSLLFLCVWMIVKHGSPMDSATVGFFFKKEKLTAQKKTEIKERERERDRFQRIKEIKRQNFCCC
uniref:ATP synthase F0 subunit 8 n=1 Tax=Panagrolaimus sp. ES5 TaxID=591445 RepID=A0AC34FHM3_9BILA